MLQLFRSKHISFVWLIEATLFLGMLLAAVDVDLTAIDEAARGRLLIELLFILGVAQIALYYSGLYDDSALLSLRRGLLGFAKAMATTATVTLVAKLGMGLITIPSTTLLLGLFLATLALPLWRLLFQSMSRNDRFIRRALVLGSGELAKDVASIIRDRCLGYQLVGFLRRADESAVHPNVVGTYEDLMPIVASQKVGLVIVADTERRGTLPVAALLALKLNGVEVRQGAEFYEQSTGRIHVQSVKPSELFFTDGFENKPMTRTLKRAFDVIVSVIALVLVAPLMLLTAVAIRLESEGPILYRQLRVGERRREFWMLKFRSMRQDAEKDGAQWASVGDTRVTRVGRIIRRIRLDELPQLWNVLRGDMSLVGPRPERPIFVRELERKIPYFSQRLYVRPGLTGHAQVRCQYAASIEDSVEKLQYDLYYIKRFSLAFDLSILLDTVKVVLLRIGSR